MSGGTSSVTVWPKSSLDLDLPVRGAEGDRVDRHAKGLGALGARRAAGPRRPSWRRPTGGSPRRAAGSTAGPSGAPVRRRSPGAADAAGALGAAGAARGVGRLGRRPAWIFSAMSRTCMRASPIAVPSRGCQAVDRGLELCPVGGRLTRVSGWDANETMPTRTLVGQLVDERLGGGLGRVEPGRRRRRSPSSSPRRPWPG